MVELCHSETGMQQGALHDCRNAVQLAFVAQRSAACAGPKINTCCGTFRCSWQRLSAWTLADVYNAPSEACISCHAIVL